MTKIKAQFITGHYLNNGNVRWYYRDENHNRGQLDIAGFRPYFYVSDPDIPDDPRVIEVTDYDYIDVFDTPLRKITMQDPTDVGGKPDSFRNVFPKHWEADIKFMKRELINLRVRGGFTFPEGAKLVHYTDISECDFTLPALTGFWDIETYTSFKAPDPTNPLDRVTCTTVWDNKNKTYITILLGDEYRKENLEEDWILYVYPSEKALLQALERYFETILPDLVGAWGSFDEEFIKERGLGFGVKFKCFKGICFFDMLSAFRRTFGKGSNRLKDVALGEGITDMIEPEVDYAELYDTDPIQLVRRNKRHVEWLVELDKKKRGLLDFFWANKNMAGLEGMNDTIYHGVLVDTLLLRKYYGRWILPSRPRKVIRESKAGGIVGDAPEGLFENVVLYDFSRYYPNIMIGRLEALGEPWVEPIIEVLKDLLSEREKYEKILNELTPGSPEHNSYKNIRDSIKYVSEAVIGYFGDEKSRLYNKKIYEMVTIPGQEGIKYLKRKVDSLGYRSLYYDTDGIFVQVPPDDRFSLMDELNKSMVQFTKNQNINRDITLKIDRAASAGIFTGVKKRYVLRVIWEDGKDVDYIHVKGMEHIRRDASIMTRRVQMRVFDEILRGNPKKLVIFLREETKKMQNGEYSLRETAIPKVLSKAFHLYKVQPDFLRGTLYSNKHLGTNIGAGEQIRMIYVKRIKGYPKTDVVCFQDEATLPELEINWEHQIDRSIRMKVEKFLNLVGLSWSQVKGSLTLSEAWA